VLVLAFGIVLGTTSLLSSSEAAASSRRSPHAVGRIALAGSEQAAPVEPGGATALTGRFDDAGTSPEPVSSSEASPATVELGYVLGETDGVVEPIAGGAYYGSVFGRHLIAPIVALVPTPDHKGYWQVGADGSVFAFGDARYEGGAGGAVRQDPVVAAAATPDGGGYWLVTSTGQVLAFGDANNYGSVSPPFTGLVIAIEPTSDAKGYWITTSTGSVFNFGDAET